jgi:branched-chain amino acid transport system ATP-binding protein
MLQLAGVSKRYGAVVVADGIALSVAAGEALGIVGPNGAGKTSLFGIIAGTVPPDAGRVLFRGRDVTRLSPARRCRLGLARTFQVPQPFGGMSVLENLLVAAAFGGSGGREPAMVDRCLAILERCGLAAQADRQAGSLTLLDRKRLELARALACEPRLLLLDEVAGGLTQPECEQLVALVREVLGAGVAILWIEHVVRALLAVVGRLAVLQGGRLIAEGEPAAVMRSPAVTAVYTGIAADG